MKERRQIPVLVLPLLAISSVTSAATIYQNPVFGVKTTSNLVYGTGLVSNGLSSENLTLDLYQPTQIGATAVPASSPTILWIHGGSWQTGDKTDDASLVSSWASYGYNVVSIDYRLLGDKPPATSGPADAIAPLIALSGYPSGTANEINASLQDADKALEWLYNNASTYGIDPSRIAVAGDSAGAINSLFLAYVDPSTHVQPVAVISAAGALPLDPSPYQPGDPAAMLIAGALDTKVPLQVVQATSSAMTAGGVYNELYVEPNTTHSVSWNTTINGETVFQHSIDFLDQHLATVPEPSTWLMSGLGALALFMYRSRLGVRR
jgi:para-nitrobenzyl esterase